MGKKHQEIIQMIQIQSITLPERKFKLRDWLGVVRLSVKDLADIVGVSRSYIHMILMGDKVPSVALFERIRSLSMGKVRDMKDLRD